MKLRGRVIGFLLGAYKYGLSPLIHTVSVAGACRFQPTCSEYAAIAVSEHGIVRGGFMALRRLLRCHPFYRGGFDPVTPNLSRKIMPSSLAAPHSHSHTRLP